MFLRTDGAPSPVSAERHSRTRRPPSYQGGAVWLCFGGIIGACSHKMRALRTRKTEHPSGAAVLLGQPN